MVHLGVEGYLPLALYLGMWVAFATSVFWRPSVGIYVVVFALPMQTGRYKLHEFPVGSNFVDILLLGVVLGLLRNGQEVVPKSPINRLLVFLAIFHYFSLWQGALFIDAPLPLWISDPRTSDWKNYVELFLFAPLVAATLKEKGQIRLLLVVMGLSMLVINRSYFGMMRDRDLTRFSYDVRDGGLLGYAGVNGFAALEAMVVAFLLGMYPYVEKFKAKVAVLLVFATSIYCLLFSFSRGAYAGTLVAIVVVGLLKSRKLLIAAVALLIGWQVILPLSVQERILMTGGDAENGVVLDHSSQGRIELWEDAVELFSRNPLIGTGFFTYEYFGRVQGFRDTHNYYVKVMVETGVVGLALFVALLYRMATMGLRLLRHSEAPFWQGMGMGFFAVICTAAVLNIFGDRWTYQQVNGFLWVLLGCVIRGHLMVAVQNHGSGGLFPTEAQRGELVPTRHSSAIKKRDLT